MALLLYHFVSSLYYILVIAYDLIFVDFSIVTRYQSEDWMFKGRLRFLTIWNMVSYLKLSLLLLVRKSIRLFSANKTGSIAHHYSFRMSLLTLYHITILVYYFYTFSYELNKEQPKFLQERHAAAPLGGRLLYMTIWNMVRRVAADLCDKNLLSHRQLALPVCKLVTI